MSLRSGWRKFTRCFCRDLCDLCDEELTLRETWESNDGHSFGVRRWSCPTHGVRLTQTGETEPFR